MLFGTSFVYGLVDVAVAGFAGTSPSAVRPARVMGMRFSLFGPSAI